MIPKKNLEDGFSFPTAKQFSRWEHFHHMADIGVRGYGRTLEEAFEQAAIALTAVITDPALVGNTEQIAIQGAAPDLEILFTDWLNALIYEMATRNMLFSLFSVKIDKLYLQADVRGEKIDVKKHRPSVEIKGATFTSLKVHRRKGLYVAQCVVDV